VLDYIEGVGQEVGYYVSELRKRKYDQALLVLSHDGNAYHGPIHKTYKDHFQDAGFEVDVIPNQGAGAATCASKRPAAFSRAVGFNEKTTQAGIEALGFYHEGRPIMFRPEAN
jgi:phage terminase large subunit